MPWKLIPLKKGDLCLEQTLRSGQSFRWRCQDDEWYDMVCLFKNGNMYFTNTNKQRSFCLSDRIIVLRQTIEGLLYYNISPSSDSKITSNRDFDSELIIRRYFNLHVDLPSLYKYWSKLDPVFKKKSALFPGIRILKQDAWETIIAFICSSNNNITRITQMVSKLCTQFGSYLNDIKGVRYYTFPTPDDLSCDHVEGELRTLGFGYRAKYIVAAAKLVKDKPIVWLDSLHNPLYQERGPHPATSYTEAHTSLTSLPGVGPKVADCICLMGMGWGEAVPVDTHVWQIAVRDYQFSGYKRDKLFSATLYKPVGDFFRSLWVEKAGWAHSVLFIADLKSYSQEYAKQISKKRKTSTFYLNYPSEDSLYGKLDVLDTKDKADEKESPTGHENNKSPSRGKRARYSRRQIMP